MAARWARAAAIATGLRLALLDVASLVFGCSVLAMLWMSFFQQIDPVRSQRVVSVEPADRYLDRDRVKHITVTREVCSRREGQVQLRRDWTEVVPDEGKRPVVLFSEAWADLKEGCHVYAVKQSVPHNLAPGLYSYDVSATFCNALNQCAKRRFDAVPVTVAGGAWVGRDVQAPPALGSLPP